MYMYYYTCKIYYFEYIRVLKLSRHVGLLHLPYTQELTLLDLFTCSCYCISTMNVRSVKKLFKDTIEAQDMLKKLEGDFYSWSDLLPYYVSLACTKKGKKAAEKLSKVEINYEKPYVVIGNKDLLRLFAVYYLKTQGTVRRGFSHYNLKDFAFQYDSADKFSTDDILFLTSGKYENYYGNTTRTLVSNIMNTVSRRQDEGQVTILLLETVIQEFLDIEEFEKLDLYKLFNIKGTGLTIQAQSKIVTEHGQDNLVEQFLNKYSDLGELKTAEKLANMSLIKSGDFEKAYRNIVNTRKLS